MNKQELKLRNFQVELEEHLGANYYCWGEGVDYGFFQRFSCKMPQKKFVWSYVIKKKIAPEDQKNSLFLRTRKKVYS